MSTPAVDARREPLTAAPLTPRFDRPTEDHVFPHNEWSAGRRIAFRFVLAYLLLYNFPFPVGELTFTSFLRELYLVPWHVAVQWFAAHVLHLAKPITVFTNGSGDTTYDYVLLLVMVIVAAVVALVWTILDRRAKAYPRLALWLRVYVRYVLAYALLSYGAFKVIKSQFPYPGLDRLVEPFGEFSPMGVVWTWMGMSYAYNLFAGLAEMVSGFLLFFRRTTMLGSLMAIAVMSNVVMINFAYDVPVKLYSTHLLLMAVFLAAPDARRLVDACMLDRGMTRAAREVTLWSSAVAAAGALLLKTALVLIGVGAPLWMSLKYARLYDVKPPLYGIWEVDSFVRGREVIPPLLGDSIRWRRMVVSYPGVLSLRLLNDSTRPFLVRIDSTANTLRLTGRRDSSVTGALHFVRSGARNDQLALDGLLNRDSLHVRLHRLDESRFLLVNRGYHWINEFPLNR